MSKKSKLLGEEILVNILVWRDGKRAKTEQKKEREWESKKKKKQSCDRLCL